MSHTGSSSSSSHSIQVSPLIYDQKNHDHDHHHHQDESMCCIICLESGCTSGILCDRPQSKPIKKMTNSSSHSSNNIIGKGSNSTSTSSWGWSFSPLTNDNHRSSSSKNKKKKMEGIQAHFICTECFSSYVKSLIEDIGTNLTVIIALLFIMTYLWRMI